jgi:hypothetical protein
MRVKLCARCPYTPRDLADYYDANSGSHLCFRCDSKSAPAGLAILVTANRESKCATANNSVMGGCVLEGSVQRSCLGCRSAFVDDQFSQDAKSGTGCGSSPPPSAGPGAAREVYSTWHMPDNPTLSCCNNSDCYPAEIQYVDGKIYARRREDGKHILIPPQKIERNRDNPDGRNHLCAPTPARFPTDTVYCFALGGAT